MQRSVLLTLGRLPKALELARGLSAAGCDVTVADPFRRHLCRPSRSVYKSCAVAAPNDDLARFLDDILEIVEREAIDLIIPISEEAIYVSLLRERLPPGVRLACADHDALRDLHHKHAFIARAAAYDLPRPEPTSRTIRGRRT